jgi:hypothetical protein
MSNAKDTIDDFYDILYEYWKALQKQYQCNVDFYILKAGEFLKIQIDYASTDIENSEDINRIINRLIKQDENGSIMETLGFYSLDQENKSSISQIVVMERGKLVEMLFRYFSQLEILKKFLKQAMLHEMGHVISNIEMYNGLTSKELVDKRNYIYNEQMEAMKKIENIKDYKAYYIAYNESPEEALANNHVGLSPEKMWKYENMLTKGMNE